MGLQFSMLVYNFNILGIYTGMWPVMVYVFLGNMAHVSMGTFAIISILVNQVIEIFQSNLVQKQLNIGKVTQFGFFRIIISRSNRHFMVGGWFTCPSTGVGLIKSHENIVRNSFILSPA